MISASLVKELREKSGAGMLDCKKALEAVDGNFEETWGDSLHLETLAEHLPFGTHTVEIELIETHKEDKVPFYLVSIIASGRNK